MLLEHCKAVVEQCIITNTQSPMYMPMIRKRGLGLHYDRPMP